MGACRNCRWWDRETNEETRDDGKEAHDCLLAASSRNQADRPETLAVALDYEGYGGRLLTTEDFGCVQFATQEGR